MTSTHLVVVAGGQSAEHEVSLISARSLLEELRDSDLTPTCIVVDRQGGWLDASQSNQALLDGHADSGGVPLDQGLTMLEGNAVVFPLIHGTTGEDGKRQGALEQLGVPYIGSGVLASALCMDKAMTKLALASTGIPTTDWRLVTATNYTASPDTELRRCQEIAGPWFVKPANQGSSVGVSKAATEAQLQESVERALKYDRRVLVEACVENARELEVALLGNDRPKASCVGEIQHTASFYDYETKYTEGRSTLNIPAAIDPELGQELQALAATTYETLDCAGFARVDFLYEDSANRFFVSEINTIPGFTPFSMFTKLWEAEGMSYVEVIETLVSLAQQRHLQGRRA